MASLCCSAAASLPHCSATATATASSTCSVSRAAIPLRIRPGEAAASGSGFLNFPYLGRGRQWSANRPALRFSVRDRDGADGKGEDEESLTDAFLSSLKNDSNYLLKAAAGSVGGATAIKYGSVLFPDVTRPNIVQGLLMVSLPVAVAVLILLKESFLGSQDED